MYRIIDTDGVQIALTEEITYIRVSACGVYTPTTQNKAEGIAVHGTAYSLLGKEPLPESAGTVIVNKFDGAEALAEMETVVDDMLIMIVAGEDTEISDLTAKKLELIVEEGKATENQVKAIVGDAILFEPTTLETEEEGSLKGSVDLSGEAINLEGGLIT